MLKASLFMFCIVGPVHSMCNICQAVAVLLAMKCVVQRAAVPCKQSQAVLLIAILYGPYSIVIVVVFA
jgi:hypothetical protein